MDAAQSRECPLCRRIAAGDLVRESADGLVVALLDAFPLAEGHTLVVPRRHKPDLFGLIADESAALWSLALELARELKAEYGADGLTIGVNAGAAAGQTVAHVHLHIVPRHAGDVPRHRLLAGRSGRSWSWGSRAGNPRGLLGSSEAHDNTVGVSPVCAGQRRPRRQFATLVAESLRGYTRRHEARAPITPVPAGGLAPRRGLKREQRPARH